MFAFNECPHEHFEEVFRKKIDSYTFVTERCSDCGHELEERLASAPRRTDRKFFKLMDFNTWLFVTGRVEIKDLNHEQDADSQQRQRLR